MAAYSAVISLLQTLERNLQIFDGQIAETLESINTTAEYFHNVLEQASNKSRFDPEKIRFLEEKIRVAANDAEDVVELEIGQAMKGPSSKFVRARKYLHKKLLTVVENIDITKKEVMEIGQTMKGASSKFVRARNNLHKKLLTVVENIDITKKEVMEIVSDLSTSTHDADDDQIVELSRESLTGTSSRSNPLLPYLEDVIVQGLDDDLEIIVERLRGPQSDLDIVTISGMGGIGKTTLARKAYDHLTIRYHFDILAWVTISQDFRNRDVLLEALRCISKQTNIVNEEDYNKKDVSELADLVQKKLKGRRYLVVVDDIWSADVWDCIRGIFPEYNNRSRILLTTRETEVAMYANPSSPHEMKLLDLDNSWKLLRDKVFGLEHNHPLELEEIGKEIAEKCQGLPLTISVIAGHLSKVARTLGSWKDAARTLGEIVSSHPDKCLGVLGLSYHHLPNHLKPCFLSIGSFPEDFLVKTRTLIQLWIAEGFVRASGYGKSLEEVAEEYLEDLISRNLIMVRKRRFNGEVKACAMHDLLREFCLKEAEMTKFVHVQRTYPAQKHNVRRFSFPDREIIIQSPSNWYPNNDLCKFFPPIARSMYFFSSLYLPFSICIKLPGILPIYRCHPVKHEFFSHFNLLRVLAIFQNETTFESFPPIITKLFHLRYLQVQFDDPIPESISELQNLQTVIFGSCRLINFPRKIWTMKNLRHINVRDSYIPSPRKKCILNKDPVIGILPNLEEMSSLCSSSYTNEVFSGIPNLKRLTLSINRIHNGLLDMSTLTKLEALKCFCNFSCTSVSIKMFGFPTSLKRLTLSQSYCPWEDISTLVMLPNLEELKLELFAASGDVWRLSDKDKFQSLKLLFFNCLDLQHWEASSDNFPNLNCLVLAYCRRLKEIPRDFGEICTLESIELHECSTSAEDSARAIEEEQEDMGNNNLKVYI